MMLILLYYLQNHLEHCSKQNLQTMLRSFYSSMRGMDIDKLDSRTWNKIKKYKSLIGYVKFKKSNLF